MKSLIFISVENSKVNFEYLFDFKDCTVYVEIDKNEFVFYNNKIHKEYKVKSFDDLKIDDSIFSDKDGNLYIVGKKLHKNKETYLLDLSGIGKEQFFLIMKEIVNYITKLEYTNPKDRWSVLMPIECENCIFRNNKTSPATCDHGDNFSKKCEEQSCPIRLVTEG